MKMKQRYKNGFLKILNVLHKIGPSFLFYEKLCQPQTMWQLHLRLLLGRFSQVQPWGMALAPNRSRNSSKQLNCEVPNGHCPSNTRDFGQVLSCPVYSNITKTSKSVKWQKKYHLIKQKSQMMMTVVPWVWLKRANKANTMKTLLCNFVIFLYFFLSDWTLLHLNDAYIDVQWGQTLEVLGEAFLVHYFQTSYFGKTSMLFYYQIIYHTIQLIIPIFQLFNYVKNDVQDRKIILVRIFQWWF